MDETHDVLSDSCSQMTFPSAQVQFIPRIPDLPGRAVCSCVHFRVSGADCRRALAWRDKSRLIYCRLRNMNGRSSRPGAPFRVRLKTRTRLRMGPRKYQRPRRKLDLRTLKCSRGSLVSESTSGGGGTRSCPQHFSYDFVCSSRFS